MHEWPSTGSKMRHTLSTDSSLIIILYTFIFYKIKYTHGEPLAAKNKHWKFIRYTWMPYTIQSTNADISPLIHEPDAEHPQANADHLFWSSMHEWCQSTNDALIVHPLIHESGFPHHVYKMLIIHPGYKIWMMSSKAHKGTIQSQSQLRKLQNSFSLHDA